MRLEFLDINLNTWSIIIFLFQVILYSSIALVVFSGNSNTILILFVILVFIFNQILFLVYGIFTNQLGFILNVVFQMFLILLTYLHMSTSLNSMIEEGKYDNR